MIGLKEGDEVVFKDDSSKIAVVADDTHVVYNGVTTSLSRLANELTGLKHPLQGTIFFTYDGELLDDRRKRMAETDE